MIIGCERKVRKRREGRKRGDFTLCVMKPEAAYPGNRVEIRPKRVTSTCTTNHAIGSVELVTFMCCSAEGQQYKWNGEQL